MRSKSTDTANMQPAGKEEGDGYDSVFKSLDVLASKKISRADAADLADSLKGIYEAYKERDEYERMIIAEDDKKIDALREIIDEQRELIKTMRSIINKVDVRLGIDGDDT